MPNVHRTWKAPLHCDRKEASHLGELPVLAGMVLWIWPLEIPHPAKPSGLAAHPELLRHDSETCISAGSIKPFAAAAAAASSDKLDAGSGLRL